MPEERYFIGPGLRDKLRDVINVVDGLTPGSTAEIPTRLQDMRRGGGGAAFRICTFTGAWSKSSQKTVTFKYITAAPNTVTATNLFANIATASGSRSCAIAKEGTAWFLIAAECD